MDREAFLKDRRKYIGASDAPVIMGVSPWKTIYQLWEDKVGLSEDKETNFAQQRGIDLEPEARNAYMIMTGNIVEPRQVFHPEIPYMMANLDGISFDDDIVVEIKCPGDSDHQTAKNGLVPEKYFPQLQHQLAVTGLNMLHYCSYRDGECIIVDFHRDDGYIKKLYLAEKRFWECVENLTPPSLSDKDYIQRDDLEWMSASAEFIKVTEELDKLKEREKLARDRLIGLSGNVNSIGSGLKLQKILSKGIVDYSKVPELQGVDLEPYRKSPTEKWRATRV